MRLIDADALMDELENEQPLNWTDSPGEIQEQADWERFKGMVSVANTIEAEPVRHGRWVHAKTYYESDECNCSLCGQLMTTKIGKRMNYCPNCGAKMDGGANE